MSIILTFYECSVCDLPAFSEERSFEKPNSDWLEY